METSKVAPFGEYGIRLIDYRPSSICKPNISRLNDCEYLMQRGCSYDIYKWSEQDYETVLRFDGNIFHKPPGKPCRPNGNMINPMHMWFKDIEDLQKWLGEYYDSVISCMLKNPSEDDVILNIQYLENSSAWSSNSYISNIGTFSQGVSEVVSNY